MNKITLIGNLTADPAQSATSAGKTMTRFRIAVDRHSGGQDGNKVTDFFRITTFGKAADACYKYLAKGRKVAVVGELRADTYQDSEGMTRLALDVWADEVEFLSAKAEEKKPDFSDIQSEDIPF